jgi:hypothetical protein
VDGLLPTATPEKAAPVRPVRIDDSLRGVGGWLSFFIFTLVVVGPAASFIRFVVGFGHYLQVFASSPHSYSLRSFYFFEHLSLFAIRGYGIFVGVQLWKIRPLAVEHAKRFLVILVLFSILDYATGIVWIVLMEPESSWASGFSGFLTGENSKALLQVAGYAAIWYTYLLKSERIRMTFSREVERETKSATGASVATPD